MKRQRPGSVLTLGILHLIGGTLGLIVVGCGGLNVALLYGMRNQLATSPDPGVRLELYLERTVPGYFPFLTSVAGMRLVLCLMLLTAGIGLLMMQQWARIVSLAYAGLSIAFKLFYAVFYLFVIWPQASTFIQQEAAQAGNAQASGTAVGMRIGFLGSVLFQIALIVYPIVVLIVLLLPAVSRAFSQPVRPRYEDEDDDWDRRGRPSGRDEDDWGRGRDDEDRDRGRFR